MAPQFRGGGGDARVRGVRGTPFLHAGVRAEADPCARCPPVIPSGTFAGGGGGMRMHMGGGRHTLPARRRRGGCGCRVACVAALPPAGGGPPPRGCWWVRGSFRQSRREAHLGAVFAGGAADGRGRLPFPRPRRWCACPPPPRARSPLRRLGRRLGLSLGPCGRRWLGRLWRRCPAALGLWLAGRAPRRPPFAPGRSR